MQIQKINARLHAVMVQWEETWTVPAYLDLPCVLMDV